MIIMKKDRAKFLAIVTGGILFNLIFWQEKIALNTLLYDAFLLSILFFLYPQASRNSTVRWLALGHLICLAMILVNNTVLSKIGFCITLGLLAGFIEYIHRSAWYAGGSMLLNGVFVTASIFDSFQSERTSVPGRKKSRKLIRFAIIPLLFAVVFFLIYSSANSVFSDMAGRMGSWINTTFSNFFNLVSWQRLLFLLAGLYLTGWILLKSKLDFFEKKEEKCEDELQRRRKTAVESKNDVLNAIGKNLMGRLGKGTLALKNMNTVGILSLALLNLLLLVVNSIDIVYIWFGFEYGKEVNLYKMIHQGTDMLIISILLAMTILIIFFRGNLNFYQNNKWLKYGSYAWLIQNSILVFSVFLRDYYYINQTGLAYKRIGVLFYLVLVLTGLTTVFLKIYKRKSTYYLFRVNAWAVIMLLVGSTTVNWDELIAKYNFKHKDNILMPVDYMLTLSNKAIPILEENADVLKEQLNMQEQLGFPSKTCETCILQTLKEKKESFMKEQEGYSWLSFNMADASVSRYYTETSKLSSK
jgi:Domain of unknown function (DUF4173)